MDPSAEESRHEQMFRHDKEMVMCRGAKTLPKPPVYPAKAVITLADGTQYTLVPDKDEQGRPQVDLEIVLLIKSGQAEIKFTGIGKLLLGHEETP